MTQTQKWQTMDLDKVDPKSDPVPIWSRDQLDPISSQAAVAELGQAALDGSSIEYVFQRAMELVGRALGVEFGWILEPTGAGSKAIVANEIGWGVRKPVGSTVTYAPNTQPGLTLASEEPVTAAYWDDDSPLLRIAEFTDVGIMAGMSVVIPVGSSPYGLLGVHTRERRRFTTYEADFLRSIANVLSGTIVNHRARQRIAAQSEIQERRLRFQAALAECAQALLGNTGEDRLDRAVRALLTATQATYVLVERNRIDPELGLCSYTVAEVEKDAAPSSQLRNEYWSMVPWDRMPISRSRLEAGQPFVIIPDELEGVEREQYASDPVPVTSELNIPIFVDGKWEGLIGFSETTVVREWTEEDISLLTTAATMIGAFWEREEAREAREQLIRAKDEFLASISHELRTPLTAVVGFAELLRDSGDTLSERERREFLDVLIAQGSDVTNIVNDLLVAAKADIGTLNVARVPVNLFAQTAQVLEIFNRDHKAQISLRHAPEVRAIGDPDRIRQIVRNLITNAIRYGGEDVHVEVIDGAQSGLLVCDSGPGIPKQDRERIFQPYQRAHNAPGVAGSLGLGLSISRKLARLMDGDLTYRHENNHSVFELLLPRAPEPPSA